jgi:hypothetical protein
MKLTDILTYKPPMNRRGLFSSWQVKVGDHTSIASTKEQAEQEAVKVLKEALTGSYTPSLFFKETCFALCWRETNGWWYCVAPIGKSPMHVGWTGVYDSQCECEEAAKRHLEQYEAVPA